MCHLLPSPRMFSSPPADQIFIFQIGPKLTLTNVQLVAFQCYFAVGLRLPLQSSIKVRTGTTPSSLISSRLFRVFNRPQRRCEQLLGPDAFEAALANRGSLGR